MSSKLADTAAQDEALGNEDERQKRPSMIVRCNVCDKKIKLMVKAKERMKTLARTVTNTYEEVFGTPIPERILWFTDSDGFAINPRSMLNDMVGPDPILYAVTTTEPEPVKPRKKPGPKPGARKSTASKDGEPAAKKTKTTTKTASKTKATTKVPTAKKGRPPKKTVAAEEVESSEDETEAKPMQEEEEEQTYEAEVVEEEGDSEEEDDEEEDDEEEAETLAVPEANGGEDSEDSEEDDTEDPMALLQGDAKKETVKQPKKKAPKRPSVHKAKKDFSSVAPSTPKSTTPSKLGKRDITTKKKVTSPKKSKTKHSKKQ